MHPNFVTKVNYQVSDLEEKEAPNFFRYSEILDVERALDGLPPATIELHLKYVTEELALAIRDFEQYSMQDR